MKYRANEVQLQCVFSFILYKHFIFYLFVKISILFVLICTMKIYSVNKMNVEVITDIIDV